MAVDLWRALHRQRLPEVLAVEAGVDYALPRYDMEALLIEVDFLADWCFAARGRHRRRARRPVCELWRDALAPVVEMPYRRPGCCAVIVRANLLWLLRNAKASRASACSISRTRLGPRPTTSLARAGRARRRAGVDGDRAAVRCTRARRAADAGFDAPAFAKAYATLTAQRAANTRHLRPPRRPRRQAAIFASSAARGPVSAVAGASRAGAFHLVSRQRAGLKS